MLLYVRWPGTPDLPLRHAFALLLDAQLAHRRLQQVKSMRYKLRPSLLFEGDSLSAVERLRLGAPSFDTRGTG